MLRYGPDAIGSGNDATRDTRIKGSGSAASWTLAVAIAFAIEVERKQQSEIAMSVV